jgi:N-succinyldiaminopimelate aminotransferase
VRPLGYPDGEAFCRDLPTRAGVVAIPHQAFHDDPDPARPYVRWTFSKRPDVLSDALQRLQRAFG